MAVNLVALCVVFAEQYKPKIIVLLEPRISGIKADRVVKNLGFDRSHRIKAEGFAGGIWVLWREVVVYLYPL